MRPGSPNRPWWQPFATGADFAELLHGLRVPCKVRQSTFDRKSKGESMRTGAGSPGVPSRLRSFDPVRIADLEYRMWVGYYLHRWPQVFTALVRLIRLGFGMDWVRTLHGAWLMLRASQRWAPLPDNDPAGARASMRRFYALVRLRYGEPEDPARAAFLEIDWWRAHRERQYSPDPMATSGELIDSLTRLYSYLYSEPEAAIRPVAVYRAQAMDLSDQWLREGRRLDSRLLPLEHAALVRAYAALLAAVHH
jgi:hypothetical protein